MTQAVRRAVVATGTTRALALKVAERREWEGDEAEWVRRVDNMLSDGSPLRVFPADCIPDAIEVTKDPSILGPAYAAVIRVQAEAAEMKRAPLVKVRSPHRDRRVRA